MIGQLLYLSSSEDVIFDDSFRYRVPLPLISNEIKKGTTITKIENYKNFCRSISCAGVDSSTHMIMPFTIQKIISSHFSCSSVINKEQDYCSWKGKYMPGDVLSVICSLIHSFLLCKNCDNPEVILIAGKKSLYHSCKACGEKSKIREDENECMYKIVFKELKMLEKC
jgi:translation initiation factor 2 beta subunit (eIF-2beta)/eIF-5